MTELNLTSSNRAFKNGIQYAWDSTSLSLAQTCLRKYKYKAIDGWRPHHFSDHLRFGQHYATALEHYYKLTFGGMDAEEALIEVVLEAMRETWDYEWELVDAANLISNNPPDLFKVTDEGTFRAFGGKPWQSLDGLKTRENLIRTIIWYLDHFADDPTPVVALSDGRPAVELSFAIEVDNGLIFSGHLDRLVTYSGDTYVMDQKTSKSTISPYYFDQYNPHMQMSMYTFAGKMVYGAPIKGVIIDAAQIAVGFTRFERGFTYRTNEQLDEWYENTLHWIATAQKATMDNFFPMNESSCYNFGGCEFRKVCSKPHSLRPNFLKADFTQHRTWDPLEKR